MQRVIATAYWHDWWAAYTKTALQKTSMLLLTAAEETSLVKQCALGALSTANKLHLQ